MKYYFLSNDIWYINVEVIRPFKKNSFFIPLKNLGFFPVYRHCMICRYCLCRRLLESTSPASDCGNAFYHYRLGNNMTSKLPYSTKLDFCYLTLSYYIETSKLQNAKISGPNFEINISFKEAEYSSSRLPMLLRSVISALWRQFLAWFMSWRSSFNCRYSGKCRK